LGYKNITVQEQFINTSSFINEVSAENLFVTDSERCITTAILGPRNNNIDYINGLLKKT
jgi:hypothetical protein